MQNDIDFISRMTFRKDYHPSTKLLEGPLWFTTFTTLYREPIFLFTFAEILYYLPTQYPPSGYIKKTLPVAFKWVLGLFLIVFV